MNVLKAIISGVLLLNWPVYGYAQTPASPANADSVGAFVQDFYDWYAPIALRSKNSLPWESVLKQKTAIFAPKLAHALKKDSRAQESAEGAVIGLDFDPFLDSQDPCEHYVVENISTKNTNPKELSYLVAIHPVCNGKLRPRLAVTAELILKKNQWLFINFYYPEGNNLLQMLGALRKERTSDFN